MGGVGPNYTVIPNDWVNLEHIISDLCSRVIDEDASFSDYILKDGSRAMTADWDAGSYVITAKNFISDVTTGTSPYACTSTTLNANLNADLWDGYQFADYLDQAVKQASSPTFVGLTLSGAIATPTDITASGTVQAEQITSTDDITMAGYLLNTMAADDLFGLNIDGYTNPKTYAQESVACNNITRKISGSGSSLGALHYLILHSLFWDYDYTGGTISKPIYTAYDSLNFTGSMDFTSGLQTPTTTLAGINFTVTNSGTFAENVNKAHTIENIGGNFRATNSADYDIQNGSIVGNFYGGYFETLASGITLTAGVPTFNYYGGYFKGVGSADGTSTVYGGYFSGTGGDTNYDIYAVNADSSNVITGDLRLGGATNRTLFTNAGVQTMAGTARTINEVWIPAESLKAPGVKPATWIPHGMHGAWEFSDATDDTVGANMRIPYRMDRTVAPTFALVWSSTTPSAYCEWQVEYLWRSADEDTTANADDTLLSSTDADASTSSATAEGLIMTTFTLAAPSATDVCLQIRIKRRADLAADTINGDTTELHGICLAFTSDKLGGATA